MTRRRRRRGAQPTSPKIDCPNSSITSQRVQERNARRGGHLVGARVSYVDLSVFQVMAGLQYAFPRAMARLTPKYPGLLALHDRIAQRERIAAYLASRAGSPSTKTASSVITRNWTNSDVPPKLTAFAPPRGQGSRLDGPARGRAPEAHFVRLPPRGQGPRLGRPGARPVPPKLTSFARDRC